MYCVLYHIYQDEIKSHPERLSHYEKYLNVFDWNEIKFPVPIKDIHKVEKLIDYGINVFGYEKSPFPLHITKRQDDKIINLLMIGNRVDNKNVQHYVYIKKLDIFATPKRRDDDGIHTDKNRFICPNCLHGFTTQELLNNHKTMGCDLFEPCRTVLPDPIKNDDGSFSNPTIQFKNNTRKFKAPVVIYADFETLIKKTGEEHKPNNKYMENYDKKKKDISTTKLADLPPCGYSFNVVSDYPELNLGFHLYRGENAVDDFIQKLLDCGDKIRDILDEEKPMIITNEQEKEFRNCQMCHICEKPIKKKDKKVRDHDHISGLYRGCAHENCNINFNYKNYLVPTYFHNLKGFDGHLIIQGLKKKNFSNIKIIAQNFEKYMTFSFGNFRMLDSFAFMSSSLDTLSSNLLKDGRHNFNHTLSDPLLTDEQKDLLLCKGVYPYEYMDDVERFNETELPPIESFYSQLSESNISKEDYEHAKKVWDTFQIKNLGDYHDLYLKTDVLLLTDVFEAFRKIMMKNYQLDPANGYFTLPNFAWDAMLKKTGVQLEQLTDINMYNMCELGIRGGISMISHRYAKANNKYMTNYDKSVIDSYIMYLDANNLYGQAMVQKLPTGDFEWGNTDMDYLKNFDADGFYGAIVECDLEYPTSLHDEHNNYPLAPESKSILKSELSPYQLNQLKLHKEGHSETLKKLVPNLYDKKNYVCHIKNLQYYLSKGLLLTKIHRVLKFRQSEWLKPYIDFNTTERTKSKNDFEKDMYKLMNNAVFGKTMENMRERVDIQLISDEEKYLKIVAKPQFADQKIYSKDLIAVKQIKRKIELNKPIYVGVAVLDLSKLHMFKFHYDYIKPKYGESATLLFTDTDSLCYHIQTEDIYKDMNESKELFDMSDYDMSGYRSKDNSNKKVIGKFKDETNGVPIVEFVGLRSKMYSILLDDKKEKKTGKGIKKSALKKYINHADYKRCLFGTIKDQRQLISFNNLRSIDHNIGLYRYTKVGLSCSNDKMYLLDDAITSLAYGHKRISNNK
jgi:ssDNA-binding Zn-finger/Zn-ribbon topoisomerase 1